MIPITIKTLLIFKEGFLYALLLSENLTNFKTLFIKEPKTWSLVVIMYIQT